MEHRVLRVEAGQAFENSYKEARNEGWIPVKGGFSTCQSEKYVQYSVLMKRPWWRKIFKNE